jgi:hypothetical protein
LLNYLSPLVATFFDLVELTWPILDLFDSHWGAACFQQHYCWPIFWRNVHNFKEIISCSLFCEVYVAFIACLPEQVGSVLA